MRVKRSKAKIQDSLGSRIKRLRQLYRRRQYEEVIRQADKILRSYPCNVPTLIMKAQAIQLLNGRSLSKQHTLQAAKQALLCAREADPQSLPALNELAFFVYAVEDKSRKAQRLFNESFGKSIDNLTEAAEGVLKCLVDENKLTEEKANRILKRIGSFLIKIHRQVKLNGARSS